MRSVIFYLLVLSVVCALCDKVEQGGQTETDEQKKHFSKQSKTFESSESFEKDVTSRQRRSLVEDKKNKIESKAKKAPKESLVDAKNERVLFEKEIEHFLKNPVTRVDRECFAKFKPGQSIDFVIDIAPSPSNDKINKMLAESPMALFLERTYRTPSRAYFSAIQLFIDAITLDMKPEFTHACIYDQGRKYYLRGRGVEEVEWSKRFENTEFTDKMRNLKTLWPVPTKEAVSNLAPIVENNLGRMTKLALWNRDNGLPTVLSGSRRSKPFYTIVISDGSSGAKLSELVDDLSRVTVIDIGNRRFVNSMKWDEMHKCAGVFSLTAPQMLPFLLETVRNSACLFSQHVSE